MAGRLEADLLLNRLLAYLTVDTNATPAHLPLADL